MPKTKVTRVAKAFGDIVKRLRTERGWTYVTLGDHTGMNPTYLSILERGGNKPSLVTIFVLADAFEVEAVELVREVEQVGLESRRDSMNLRIFDSLEDLTRAAARTIAQHAPAGGRAAIALSGGSTPKPVYELLGRDPNVARCAVTWVVVDERYVPPGDPQSNSSMIERTLFANGIPDGHRFLRFQTELGDPERTVRAFEEEWRALGIESLDLVVLGVGDDGHTASLFPGTPVLEVDDALAAAVFVPRLDQWRVTLTLPVLRAAKRRIVLAAGASKERILREVREGADYPIAAATNLTDTWWLVDRAAAGKTAEEETR